MPSPTERTLALESSGSASLNNPGHSLPPAPRSARARAVHWPLPQGVADLFLEDAAGKRSLEQDVRALFARWGYGELIPPTFEYADTLASEAGTQLAEEMYRFVDRDGRTLALRPDLTIPTARVVGTRLFDQPLPLRLFYIGSVFRYERPQAGRQREFTQAGIELIGAGTPDADGEVLALTVEALRTAGLQGFQVALGQMAFFRGLLAEWQVAERQAEAVASLQSAIDRKNRADLESVLQRWPAPEALRRALLALPGLNGGPEILELGRSYCLNEHMRSALDWLRALEALLAAYGLAEVVSFDLGETRGMEYYTGITFKGYAPGLGFSVCSGGRYDDLVGHFGPAQPAVGCALWLDRLLLARQRQGRRPQPQPLDLLLAAGACPACVQAALALRKDGLRVEIDVTKRAVADLLHYAHERRAVWVALCLGAGQLRLWRGAEERLISQERLVDEVMGR